MVWSRFLELLHLDLCDIAEVVGYTSRLSLPQSPGDHDQGSLSNLSFLAQVPLSAGLFAIHGALVHVGEGDIGDALLDAVLSAGSRSACVFSVCELFVVSWRSGMHCCRQAFVVGNVLLSAGSHSAFALTVCNGCCSMALWDSVLSAGSHFSFAFAVCNVCCSNAFLDAVFAAGSHSAFAIAVCIGCCSM